MAETKQLNVGDVVYQDNRWGMDRHIIDRVTPKMAFASNLKFKLEYLTGGPLHNIGNGGTRWATGYYYAETPELKQRFEIRMLRYKISQVKLSDLPIDKIKAILAIVNTN